MKECSIIIDNEVWCRVHGLNPEDNTTLCEKFAIHVDGYFYMPQYKLGRWDGKARFFEKTGKTYTKLLSEIIPYLVSWNYKVNLTDNRIPFTVIDERVHTTRFENFTIDDKPILMRPYQVEHVNRLLDETCGFLVCATGGGKTIMCAALADVLAKNGHHVIVIVPSDDLVKQTRATFEACGIDTGQYSGSEKSLDHQVVIATWQALQYAPHNMQFFQAMIIDEAHGLKADVIKSLVNENGKHLAYRYGVTGTFPKGEADQYSLKTSIGQVHGTVTARWLIDNGYLSEINIEPIQILEAKGTEQFPDYGSERAYLTRKPARLELIAKLIQLKAQQFGNTMVLVSNIPQGKELQELIPNSVFLYGESESDIREQYYSEYADRDDVVVIASAGIASTGISIDRIFCLFLVDAGKSFIRCIQSVGRGLRRKGDKYFVNVVDVYSSLKHSKKHAKERATYYAEAEYPMQDPIKLKY